MGVWTAVDLAAISPTAPRWHRGNEQHPQNLLPFEQELKDLILTFQKTTDPEDKVELMKQYNEIFTSNIYHVGLTVAPGALIVNQRLRNVPEGAPILAYQWAEDSIIRERMWVPAKLQLNEIFEGTLPGIN